MSKGISDKPMFTVAALYQFARLDAYSKLKPALEQLCKQRGIQGSILLASEGINGTVAGSRLAIDKLISYLQTQWRLDQLNCKFSTARVMPFHRMKVRLKKEIVTLGVPGISPLEQVGEYVEPADWNELIGDPDVVVVDARNDYEIDLGTFKGADNPQTQSFGQFPDYVKAHLDKDHHKKVAMFCTGGIRCEKATSYLLAQGFEQVYHLHGGILKYLEDVSEGQSMWKGECYVFDGRVSVKHQLEQGKYGLCHGCGRPIQQADKQKPTYQHGVSCPACFDQTTDEQKKRWKQRQYQIDLAKSRGEKHLGVETDV